MTNISITTHPTGRSPENKYFFGEQTKYLDLTRPKFNKIGKGKDFADFYAKMQFNHEGRSYYRIPSQWPVEIHNQAQGIISFSRWGKSNEQYELAQSILEYSVTNMRSSKGFFFYKKYPWITIKIPFIRWSQAWMFLALEEFLHIKESE